MKWLWILLFFLFTTSLNAAERKSPRDFMVIGRDYGLVEEVSVHPLSLGINSYYTKELGTVPAFYGSIAFLSYRDFVRLELGGTTAWNRKMGYMNINALTGISLLVKDRFVIGVYLAPFWNLAGSKPDDPWGIMLGWAW